MSSKFTDNNPKQWSGQDVRNLRQRLGWSQAEMARRLGVTLAALNAWEDKEQLPAEDLSDQLHFMVRHLETHSAGRILKPVAEALMTELKLTQIHVEQVAQLAPEKPPKESDSEST